jgi:CBS domain-containing protein
MRLEARDVMTEPAITVSPDTTIPAVAAMMRRQRVGGFPVVDAAGKLVGVVTETDLLLKEAGAGGRTETSYMRRTAADFQHRPTPTVADVMSRTVVTADEDTSVRELARLMTRHGAHHVPILRDGRIVGIVSRADIVSAFERPSRVILADVQAMLLDGLCLDPERFDIVVDNGVVSMRGEVDRPGTINLIQTLVAEIDGVAAVDTSQMTSRASA